MSRVVDREIDSLQGKAAAKSGSSVPAYLGTPPTPPDLAPPAVTRQQTLPFSDLRWQDFERLIYRLVSLEVRVEQCVKYGRRGEKQEGIDVYARPQLGKKYWTYQCKRVKRYTASSIRTAVDVFLEGKWVDRSDCFVICASRALSSTKQLDELEVQHKRLKTRGIKLDWWDQEKLSLRLKSTPELVDDFFGRQWVEVFNGAQTADGLGDRFDVFALNDFRGRFRRFYKNIFRKHDPGLPTTAFSSLRPLGLAERYVVPDVIDLADPPELSIAEPAVDDLEERFRNLGPKAEERRPVRAAAGATYVLHRRQSLADWLDRGSRFLIVGGPGIGKSSLLRFLTLDLLAESPKLGLLAPKWGSCLPVWMPFGLWTKLIAERPGEAPRSLEVALEAWFASWSEGGLWRLASKALRDRRVLLLVDGLDEWSDESAASLALQLLQVYVEQRALSVVVTTRPRGAQQLGMAQWDCAVGELAGLSQSQMANLARNWFGWYFQAQQSKQGADRPERSDLATKEADSLVADLERASDLRELAQTPLLFTLLMVLRLRQVRLPANRFLAYGALVDQLLIEHPRRRRQAAFLTGEPITGLTDRELKGSLAHLAFNVLAEEASGVASRDSVESFIREYLSDTLEGLGRPSAEASLLANQIVATATSEFGLLVEVTPGEIGFLHRALLQYLAGYHLAGLPVSEQLNFVRSHKWDSEWHESILSLISRLQRRDDVAQIVKEIKTGATVTPDRFPCQLLLAEICFGDFDCPPALVNKLARDVFEEIENGPWLKHRERLLQSALDGLGAARPIRDTVYRRLKGWFPCTSEYRTGLFEAMSHWPSEESVIETLFRGLNDEEPSNQVAAAESLAQVAGGKDKSADDLLALFFEPFTTRRRAPALLALLGGWAEDTRTQRAVREARKSNLPELRLLSMRGRIQEESHLPEDLETFLKELRQPLGYPWSEMVAPILLKGWPRSEQVRDLCLSIARSKGRNIIHIPNATWALLTGYPGDEAVVEYCVEQINSERFPFVGFGFGGAAWRTLAINFRDNPQIVEATDNWMDRDEGQRFHEPAKSYAALIGRTDKAKQHLLHDLTRSQIPFWAANALLEGWGMEDPKVSKALSRKADASVAESSLIAHHFPSILGENRKCARRLFQLLEDESCPRPDLVMRGLTQLVELVDADRVVSLGLRALDRCPQGQVVESSIVNALVENYSQDDRVRSLALGQFMLRDGEKALVTRAYGHDAEIRVKVQRIATPLPQRLRSEIVHRLLLLAEGDVTAREVLADYNLETQAEIQVQAAVGLYSALARLDTDQAEHIEKLRQDVASYGPTFESRRQAALAGLICLGRLDVMVGLRETIGEDRPIAVTIDSIGRPNLVLARLIAERFAYISQVFESDLESRLTRDGKGSLWESLTLVADGLPEMSSFLRRRWEEERSWNVGLTTLIEFERLWPRSDLLLRCCLKLIAEEEVSRVRNPRSLTAGEMVGRSFRGDSTVLEILSKKPIQFPVSEPLLVALCEGWPGSDTCSRAIAVVTEGKQHLRAITLAQVTAIEGNARQVVSLLLDEVQMAPDRRTNYEDLANLSLRRSYLRPLLRRVTDDDDVAALLEQRLRDGGTFEAANVPFLLQLGRGLRRDLREWCLERLQHYEEYSLADEILVAKGVVIPVPQALVDVVYGSRPGGGYSRS